jgi:uncharacterized protein involved in outer membrane biogenesis
LKKIIYSFFVIILVFVGGAFIGPTMIDWNAYKGDVTKKIKALTGRELKIFGDVMVTIFPTPAIIANDISFSNMVDAAKPSMIRVQQAEVRISLSPLLLGEIRVETVRLIKPVIELEITADGAKNWEMKALISDAEVKQKTAKKSQVFGPSTAPVLALGSSKMSVPAVILNDFTIVDGVLNYRNLKLGTVERIEDLNAKVEAVSLIGPFQSNGSLTLRNTALTYDITIGEVIKERTLPLNLKLGIAQESASLHIGGNIFDLLGAPKFRGHLKGESKNLGLLFQTIIREPTTTKFPQLFSIEGNVSASMQGFEINNLAIQLADSKIEGDISLELGDIPRFSVNVSAEQFDLDKWFNTSEPELVKTKPELVKTKEVTKKNTNIAIPIPIKKEQEKTQELSSSIIPDDISGSVIISVEAMNYRGKSINDIIVNTELKNGIARLSQGSAQFPGGTEISLFGDLTTPNGVPQFSGNIEAYTNDLWKITNWFDIKMPNISADRLRKVNFSSTIMLTREEIKAQGLSLKFDSSKLTGAATIALRPRLGFGANLTLDQIDVDSYLGPPLKPKTLKTKIKPKSEIEKSAANKHTLKKDQKKNKDYSPLKSLSKLAGFDANVLLEIKKLDLKGEKLRGVVVDASLYDGSLDIRKFKVAQFAGVAVATFGKIEDLGYIPRARGLHINLKSKNLKPIAHLLGVKFSFDGTQLGKTSVDFRVNGSFLAPNINASIKTGGASINTSGKISMLPIHDAFNLKAELGHPNLARFMRNFGLSYQPSGRIGGITLALNIKGNPKSFTFDQMSGKVGELNFGGIGSVDLSGLRPKITADINVSALDLNPFLPTARKVGLAPKLWGKLKLHPVVWPGPKPEDHQRSITQIANKGFWSNNLFDVSILKVLDADIAFRSPLLTMSNYLFKKIDFMFEIKNGTLITKRLKARMFGGQLQGDTKIIVGKTNQITSTFKILGIKISDALASINRKVTANGLLDVNLDFTASGKSVAGLVGSLNGTGGFIMKGVDVSAGVKGSAFSGVYNLLTSLNQIGHIRSRNQTDVNATFKIVKGVAKTNDLKLTSLLGDGVATGTVDLVGWLLNMKGQIQLEQNALTQILQAKFKHSASPVGFTLTGPLDAPNVRVDTRALLGGSVPILGADTLLKKAPKKVKRILKGLLGRMGNTSPAPKPTNGTSLPGSTQQQESEKLNAKDLLKELFK